MPHSFFVLHDLIFMKTPSTVEKKRQIHIASKPRVFQNRLCLENFSLQLMFFESKLENIGNQRLPLTKSKKIKSPGNKTAARAILWEG